MPIDWFPLWLSLRVALAATALGIAVGVAIAYLLANRDFRGKEALDAAVTLPLVLPPTVLGYYLLVVIGRESPIGQIWEKMFGSPLVFTWKAAVAAAFLHSFPLLVKSSRAALENIDRSYERAARTLGASEWKLFWRVTLPRPSKAGSRLPRVARTFSRAWRRAACAAATSGLCASACSTRPVSEGEPNSVHHWAGRSAPSSKRCAVPPAVGVAAVAVGSGRSV